MNVLLVLSCAALCLSCRAEKISPWAAAAKACHEDELSCVRPILNVRSLQASLAYFRDSLGFTVDWQHGEPADFGSVSRGHGVFFLCEGCQGTPGAWAMAFTDRLDVLHAEFARNGARIRMPPRKMPWGLREMHVSDPDGNVIRFAQGDD